nr:transposase [Histophilus somni]
MKKETEIRRGRHVVFNLHVHLVFVTKYRREVFTARLDKKLNLKRKSRRTKTVS